MENYSTIVTDQDLAEAVTDGYGVKYSRDGKRLLKAPRELSGSYTIKPGTKVICDSAFSYCKLTNIVFPDCVRCIGDSAFWVCESLRNIVIPNSVAHIGDCAFGFCGSLESITIPASVKEVKGNPFCRWHGELINKSPYFTYEDYVLFSKNKDKLIAFRQQNATSYAIPVGVTHICDHAFSGCGLLESITISGSVASIGYGAFWWCKSLIGIEIPDSVTSIGDYAFGKCFSLTNIIIPVSVTSIGDHAFYDCSSLTSVTIPNSVKSVGKSAFWRCRSLSKDMKDEIERRFGQDPFKQPLY